MSQISERISRARARRGLSLRELANRVGVSAQAISKYERGLMKPGSDVLLRLAQALDVQVEFFLRPIKVDKVSPAYRKTAIGKKAQRALEEEIRDWLERYIEAEEISPVEPPRFEYPRGFPMRISDVAESEEAAELLRERWDIGIDPIESITNLLEDKGIRVGQVSAPKAFDACVFLANGSESSPVIVTQRDSLPGDRQRFSLAHELGHLMLRVDGDADEEKAGHRFAGAFLVPAETLRADMGEHRASLSISELLLLKQKWGMSMQALIYRAKDLGIISDFRATSLFKLFRKRGWNAKEPGPQIEPEHPERFELIVHQAVAEGIIREGRARELLGGRVAELAPTAE